MAEVSDFHDESFRDTVSHVDAKGKRVWFFPKKPVGQLYQYRKLLSYGFLLLFFTLPFIKIDGDPFMLFNVVERKFVLFGVRFWPQDFFLLVIGMLIFIVFISLFTVVYGRVFCGWICPQTIFMEMLFRRIEYAIEGDAAHQRALKKAPWNREKIIKRALKISIFFIVSVIVANTFLSYIIGIDELKKIVTEPLSQHVGGFTAMIVFSGVFFFIYYWFREQVCLVVCPYGRMQGVLLDKHSIVVAYDYKRGEPRAKFSKKPEKPVGDCIDCNECVRVCPTGIDIRHGTQLECVNCTACIDACNGIMEKVNRPKGLIRYASEHTIQTGSKLKWTTRIIAYSVVLVVLIGVEAFFLATRTDVDITINRARGQIFTRQADGKVNNLYMMKITNKTKDDLHLDMQVDGAELVIIGENQVVKADTMVEGQFFIMMPESLITKRKYDLQVMVYSNGKLVTQKPVNFIGPANAGHTEAEPQE
jgi:cytochrome c oxidase accessory protein FixG